MKTVFAKNNVDVNVLGNIGERHHVNNRIKEAVKLSHWVKEESNRSSKTNALNLIVEYVKGTCKGTVGINQLTYWIDGKPIPNGKNPGGKGGKGGSVSTIAKALSPIFNEKELSVFEGLLIAFNKDGGEEIKQVFKAEVFMFLKRAVGDDIFNAVRKQVNEKSAPEIELLQKQMEELKRKLESVSDDGLDSLLQEDSVQEEPEPTAVNPVDENATTVAIEPTAPNGVVEPTEKPVAETEADSSAGNPAEPEENNNPQEEEDDNAFCIRLKDSVLACDPRDGLYMEPEEEERLENLVKAKHQLAMEVFILIEKVNTEANDN